MSRNALHDRARAVFLGVALGDALGATTEFMTPREIQARYRVHCKIRGGGWLGLKGGNVTDDTEMSLAIARALVDAGRWDLPGIADNLLAWMRGKPIDIGATVRRGISSYLRDGTLEMPYSDGAAGNGAAMRMAPVALFCLGDDRLLWRYAQEQARLTHNHPLSDAACICLGRMVQAALLGADRFQLHAITRELVAEHPNFRFNDYKGQASGYVVETLQTVFHYFFSTASFEECLVGVVNQGGDADTTGAIAGMLAGAFYGDQGLPKQWLKKLNKEVRCEVEQLARELVDLSPAGKRLAERPEERDNVMPERDKLSIAEVATSMRTTQLNVLMHIKNGLLEGEEIDGTWYVGAGSLANCLRDTERINGSVCAVKHHCGGCAGSGG